MFSTWSGCRRRGARARGATRCTCGTRGVTASSSRASASGDDRTKCSQRAGEKHATIRHAPLTIHIAPPWPRDVVKVQNQCSLNARTVAFR